MPTSPTGNRRPGEAGLSLIELVIVLALIGILGVVALPRVATTLDQDRLNYTARRVVGAVRLPRSEAITRGEKVNLDFDLRFGLIRLSGPEGWSKKIRIEEPARIDTVLVRHKGEKRTKNKGRLEFRPDGRVSEAAVYLRDGEKRLTLHVEPLTGRVEVLEGVVRYAFGR